MNSRNMKNFISLLLTMFITPFSPSQASDTLNTTHTLRDINGGTLISSSGSFELGFFTPKNSNNRYLGIWYKKIAEFTVVWIANNEAPLSHGEGLVRVIEPGVLLLLNSTNATIWSTISSKSVKNPVARLLDSGNLVVKDADDENPENFLWQSFDYPTDTFLPGMKLGKNYVTGLEVYITSPKGEGDPASGDHTYWCDPTGYPQNVIKRGDRVTYRTGPWNGKGFSGNPNLQKNNIFRYDVVINEREVYYQYSLVNESLITRFTISESGVGHRWIWVERTQEWSSYLTIPVDNCDIYNGCGPYGSCNIKNSPSCGCLDRFEPKDAQGRERGDWSNGCIRSTPLDCEKGDAFLKYSGVKLPDTRSSWYNKSMSLEECKMTCLRNCSCMAYTSLDISRGGNGDGCLLWFGELVDIREISPGQDIYIRMASSEIGSDGRKREIFIVTFSVVVGVLLLCLVLYSRKRKKLDRLLQETQRSRLSYVDSRNDESHESKDLELPLLDLATLMEATDSFSFNNKLGEGGFGPVYKGQLDEGREIAVKRLSRTSLQGVDEFKNEVICIAKLQHRNLVKLLGCCIQGEERILVYEYMTNKSLDLILFDPMKSMLLDWRTRFNIINGIARGLMYLHQDSPLRVIHRDLKASNILLDSDMNPKISDFGLARTFGGDETGANTNRVVGTYGYMSPEYAVGGLFSVKSDVFSFGVLVLEIVSGKRNRGFSHRDHRLNLLGHAWMLYNEERSQELVDPCLRSSCDLAQVVRSIHIGLLCVQELPQDRPTMSLVVMMLNNEGLLPQPKHPGFFAGREILKGENSISSNASSSTNAITITLPQAR